MEKEIYLAGGCFWGMEKYLGEVRGVLRTDVGYANGTGGPPSYEAVCRGDHGFAETVRVTYDPELSPLPFLIKLYFDAVDPTAVELLPLLNYHSAEEYHQDYLDKNPGGYCHLGPEHFARARSAQPEKTHEKPGETELRVRLTPEQYAVTQENATEPPFQNEFWDKFTPGIYVDIVTGAPLFLSTEKFQSGCGWPSFSRPIQPGVVTEYEDRSHGMHRTEVKSREGTSHLGHVFPDGPAERGGLRYCINSAALRFVPKERMEAEGYGSYLSLLDA